MKSRMVILTMLVFGMLLSTAGAGLAVSSLSGGNAAIEQYGKAPPKAPAGDVLGDEDAGGGTQPSAESGGNGPSGDTQPSRQLEAGADTSGGELPFTGFAAIPILFGGVALLAGGLVLRSRGAGAR